MYRDLIVTVNGRECLVRSFELPLSGGLVETRSHLIHPDGTVGHPLAYAEDGGVEEIMQKLHAIDARDITYAESSLFDELLALQDEVRDSFELAESYKDPELKVIAERKRSQLHALLAKMTPEQKDKLADYAVDGGHVSITTDGGTVAADEIHERA